MSFPAFNELLRGKCLIEKKMNLACFFKAEVFHCKEEGLCYS
jgi:hypothetical protein